MLIIINIQASEGGSAFYFQLYFSDRIFGEDVAIGSPAFYFDVGKIKIKHLYPRLCSLGEVNGNNLRLPIWIGGKIKHLGALDRKSTRLNSSHVRISYAVFC